ncbi:MAG: outer membrane lipoprotein carrier protein LolA, partial [Candidatus Dadabacteria bacterium]
MIRAIVTFVVLLFLAVPEARALSERFQCSSARVLGESAGERLISRLQESYNRLSSFKADFLQESYLLALDTSEISAGTVYFDKPGRMRWEYRDPAGQLFIIADNTFWYYQPDERQVLVDSVQKAVLSDLPLSFLMGLGDLKKSFRLIKACQRKNSFILILSPESSHKRNNGTELQEFSLLVSGDDYIPIGASIRDIAGNITSIVFENLKINITLDPNI